MQRIYVKSIVQIKWQETLKLVTQLSSVPLRWYPYKREHSMTEKILFVVLDSTLDYLLLKEILYR